MKTRQTLINMAYALNEANMVSGDFGHYEVQLEAIEKYKNKEGLKMIISIELDRVNFEQFHVYFKDSSVDIWYEAKGDLISANYSILLNSKLPKSLKRLLIDNLNLIESW